MELNADFINIQGILLDLEKSIGELKKIEDRSGNEEKISQIINKFRTILLAKKYIKNDRVNDVFNQQIKEFVLFVFLNCDVKNSFEKEEYSHLTNITPQISKCLLIILATELDLTSYLCTVLEEFPLAVIEEILMEVIDCIKFSNIEDYRKNAKLYLQLILRKLSNTTSVKGVEEIIEKIIEAASRLLLHLTTIQSSQLSRLTKSTIYKHMGFNLMAIFDLLLEFDQDNSLISPIIHKALNTCCSILTGVTIDVYCCWAEVHIDEKPLQLIVGEKAFQIIEKYNKYPDAKSLIGMLGNIAQKPKPLNELIQQADTATMIKMINKCDENQLKWFQALFTNYAVLSNKESIDCIKRWAHLCTQEEVRRLLHLTENTRGNEYKNEALSLAIKCAGVLELNDLISVTIAHFHRNGTERILNEDINQEIILLFNKFKDNAQNEEFTKTLYLLLLQNPIKVFSYIFGECLKSHSYTPQLNKILSSIKEIGEIQDLALKVLTIELNKYPPDDQNIRVYIILLDNLIEFKYFTMDKLMLTVILPILQNSLKEHNLKVIKPWLGILNLIRCISVTNESRTFFQTLFEIMKAYRCEFLQFELGKQEIVKEIVDLLSRYENLHLDSSFFGDYSAEATDPYVTFYRNKLCNSSTNLLEQFHPNYNLENHAEVVCYLIKILPRCVKREWLAITTILFQQAGVEKAGELITDVLVVLCHFIKSQTNATNDSRMTEGLKYNLQQFGVVQEYLQRQISNINEDISITKNTCRLLIEIPNAKVKSETGLTLICSLSESSLKALNNDEKFKELVKRIDDTRICQFIFQKMIE